MSGESKTVAITWKHKTEWMGHRPAPADSIPVIGESPIMRGAFPGFGHHHVGLTSGPKTGRVLAQLVSGADTQLRYFALRVFAF